MNEHGLVENGQVNQVVYDFEFIEDYSVPAQPPQSTVQDIQLNTTYDPLWFLIDNEAEDDGSSKTKKVDVPKKALWDPKKYYALQHPLALMVHTM